jgi:hypothetical protein
MLVLERPQVCVAGETSPLEEWNPLQARRPTEAEVRD